MSDLNVVCLTGRLGRDPELTYTPTGKAVLNLDLAVAGSGGEGAEVVHWVPLVCWGKTAENMATYLGKGSRVAVEGRLQVRKWEKDGQARSKMEVVAERVTFLESRKRGEIGPESAEEIAPEAGDVAAEPAMVGHAEGTFDPKVPF
jgi:single-strand DNA-binding protein